MSKNIEINVYNGNSYEALYPKTSWNNIINAPTIPTVPSLPLSVGDGGTGVTSYSSLASELNDYITHKYSVIITSYLPTGATGLSDSLTVSFGSGRNGILVAVGIIAYHTNNDFNNTVKEIVNTYSGIVWFFRGKNNIKHAYNGEAGGDWTFNNTSIKFGGKGSNATSNILNIVNYKSFSNENWAIGLFGATH